MPGQRLPKNRGDDPDYGVDVILALVIFGLSVLILLPVYYSTKKTGRYFLASGALGVGALMAVGFTAVFTGAYIPINFFNGAVSLILGLPGVITLLLTKTFL